MRHLLCFVEQVPDVVGSPVQVSGGRPRHDGVALRLVHAVITNEGGWRASCHRLVQILQRFAPFYAQLSEEKKALFRERIALFIESKEFIGFKW